LRLEERNNVREYAESYRTYGTGLAELWNARHTPRSLFGDAVLATFLLVQVLDGALTYTGVISFGVSIEGNPLLGWLMTLVGEGPALAGTKVLAGCCGIALHLTAVHRVLGALTCIYLAAAIVPWTALLFF
jgi:hypothetical protein